MSIDLFATQFQLGCLKNQHQMSLQKQYYQQTYVRIVIQSTLWVFFVVIFIVNRWSCKFFLSKCFILPDIPKNLEFIIYVTTLRVYTLMVNWCVPNRWDPSGKLDLQPSSKLDLQPSGKLDLQPSGKLDLQPSGKLDLQPSGNPLATWTCNPVAS